MSHRIACYTLFDITKTGIANRGRPGDDIVNVNDWYYKRNTQCNFDTILQIISLRSQPEIVKDPVKQQDKFNKSLGFGSDLLDNNEHTFWMFEFTVQHPSVFENGIIELGGLYESCDGVPMINCNTNWERAGSNLDISSELRNIYFVKY